MTAADTVQNQPPKTSPSGATYTGGSGVKGADGKGYAIDNYSDGTRRVNSDKAGVHDMWLSPGVKYPGLDFIPVKEQLPYIIIGLIIFVIAAILIFKKHRVPAGIVGGLVGVLAGSLAMKLVVHNR